jgi:1-deoxy-D-xylulose-5-phosphate reductoisomerase
VPEHRKVAILGSTGSIGQSGLAVCAEAADRFEVVALAANSSAAALAEQVEVWRPRHVAMVSEVGGAELRERLAGSPAAAGCRLHLGISGLLELIETCGADVFLLGIGGAACLESSFAVARKGAILALANKESIVMAGPLLLAAAAEHGAPIIPVDSEHSALFQALHAGRPDEVRRLHLTSSGGPLRLTPREEFPHVTVAQALAHPRWKMGAKISIDSATMMNKALEIVEARWLFSVDAERINVVIHPQAIVHSIVEYVDGSLVAQMGVPDMKVPIRYALGYPDRVHAKSPGISYPEFHELQFHEPDLEKFPALELGYRAARAGGTMGAVLNAANEVAVERFLAGRIRFDQIAESVARVMDRHDTIEDPVLEDVRAADRWARSEIERS